MASRPQPAFRNLFSLSLHLTTWQKSGYEPIHPFEKKHDGDGNEKRGVLYDEVSGPGRREVCDLALDGRLLC